MYFEDDMTLPALIPVKLNRKKKNQIEGEDGGNEDAAIHAIANQFIKYQQDKEQEKKIEKEFKPSLAPDKIEQISKKFQNLQENGSRKDGGQRKNNLYKEKQSQKSKHMITEMMKKINAKNISEELHPVTNQAILDLLRKMDGEIDQLKIEAERKENSLVANPNNQHLKKELQILKTAIDRCVYIQELLNEKINLRNKVSILQKNIISIKDENANLKIRLSRSAEDAENHKLGLPCERQKQLKDALNKCQIQLKHQRIIRQKLQGNINDIVLNFKRLYEEADAARLIVTKKLKLINERENSLIDHHQVVVEPVEVIEKKSTLQLQALEERRIRASQNNDTSNVSQTKPHRKELIDKNIGIKQSKQKQKEIEKTVMKNKTSGFTMEEQIRKMQGNRTTIGKNR